MIICECYSRDNELSTGLVVSFDNIQDWKGIQEKAGEINSGKPYIINDGLSVEFSMGVTVASVQSNYPHQLTSVLDRFTSSWHSEDETHNFLKQKKKGRTLVSLIKRSINHRSLAEKENSFNFILPCIQPVSPFRLSNSTPSAIYPSDFN